MFNRTPRSPIQNDEVRVALLSRTAKEVKSYQTQKRILLSALSVLLILVLLLYIAAILYRKTGSFTVHLDKYDMARNCLTLSESRTMDYHTSQLEADINEYMTNISGDSIPDNVDMIDGQHNGENYIAYTFYMKNTGQVAVPYEYSLKVSNVTRDLDEAIRIRLYVDGKANTYAKTRSDGMGPELGTKEFYSESIAVQGRTENFQPGAQTKFTVVMWIEGDDPDCIDWLIGGRLRADMYVSAIG